MAGQLDGRVALVTGAGSGIAEAAAELLAGEGARVACLGRTREKVEETVDRIRGKGGQAVAVVADISKVDDVRRAYAEVERAFGGALHVVFANAGVNGTWAPIADLEPDEWRKTHDVNLFGTFLTLKYAVPLLQRSGGGSVIVTSSVNGTRIFSNPGASCYAASKAGQVALAKAAALELARDRIRVNVICPGAIETEIEQKMEKRNLEDAAPPAEFPAGRIPLTGGKPGSAEQVARLVLFLASDAADHITGTEMWIDGGESLMQG